MALNITDEKLQALQSAPDEERIKFFDTLSDDEKAQLASAVSEWKSRSRLMNNAPPVREPAQPSMYGVGGAPSPSQAPDAGIQDDPVSQPSAPSAPAPATPSFIDRLGGEARDFYNAEVAPAARGFGQAFARGANAARANPMAPVLGGGYVAAQGIKSVVDPSIEALQGKFGRPAVDAIANSQAAINPNDTPAQSEARKYGVRKTLSMFGGDPGEMPPEAQRHASGPINQYVPAAMELGGGALVPIPEMPFSKAGEEAANIGKLSPKFAQRFPLITKVVSAAVGSAMEGSVAGAGFGAVTPKADMAQSAAVGAGVGGVLGGALTAGGEVLGKVARPIATLTRNFARGLVDEFEQLGEGKSFMQSAEDAKLKDLGVSGTGNAAEEDQPYGSAADVMRDASAPDADVHVTKHNDPNFRPGMAMEIKGKDGTLVGRLVDVSPHDKPKIADIPLTDEAGLKAYRDAKEKHNVVSIGPSSAAYDDWQALPRAKQELALTDREIKWRPYEDSGKGPVTIGEEEEASKVGGKRADNDAPTRDVKVRPAQKGETRAVPVIKFEKPGADVPVNVDATPADVGNKAGTFVFEPAEKPFPPRIPDEDGQLHDMANRIRARHPRDWARMLQMAKDLNYDPIEASDWFHVWSVGLLEYGVPEDLVKLFRKFPLLGEYGMRGGRDFMLGPRPPRSVTDEVKFQDDLAGARAENDRLKNVYKSKVRAANKVFEGKNEAYRHNTVYDYDPVMGPEGEPSRDRKYVYPPEQRLLPSGDKSSLSNDVRGPRTPGEKEVSGAVVGRIVFHPEPPAEMPHPIHEEGSQVYMANPAGGGKGTAQMEGIVRGMDPAEPGHALVQKWNPKAQDWTGKMVSWPQEHLHPIHPDGYASFNDYIAGVDTPVPAKPDLSQVSPPMAQEIDTFYKLWKATKFNFLDRAGSFLKKNVLKPLLADHFFGPPEITASIMKAQASHNLARTSQAEVLKVIRKGMPEKALFDAVATDMSALAEGKIKNLSEFAKLGPKHAEMAKTIGPIVKDVLSEMQRLSQSIEDKGGIKPGLSALRDEGVIDQYVTRVYRAHYLGKGRWADIAPWDAQLWKGVETLTAKLKKSSRGWNESKVTKVLQEIMQDDNPIDAFYRHESGIGKPFAKLLKKGQVPDFMRGILGEENSGPIRVAFTVGAQRAIENTLGVMDTIWKARVQDSTGKTINPYWSPGPRPDTPIKVPDNKRFYGRLAGGYVVPELEPVVKAADPFFHGLMMQRALGTYIKGNLLFRPRTHINNTIRNWKYAVVSGGLDPWNPVESGKAFWQAWQLLNDWRKNPTDPTGDSIIMEARRAGALPAGLGHTEAMPQLQDTLLRQMAKEYGAVLPEDRDTYALIRALRRVKEGYKTAIAHNSALLDFEDQIWKLGSYINIRNKMLGELHAQGVTGKAATEQAATHAATMIKWSFPDFEHVGRVVDIMRRSPLGAIAPFFSSWAENQRINMMTGYRLKGLATDGMGAGPGSMRDARNLAWRLAAAGMFVSGLYGASRVSRRLAGVADEEWNAMMSERTQSKQGFDIAPIATPFRDTDGRPLTIDGAQPFEDLQMLYGDPSDPILNRVVANNLVNTVQNTPQEDFVRKYLDWMGLARNPQRDPRMIEGMQEPMNVLGMWFKAGGAPGVASDVYEALRKNQQVGVTQRNESTMGTAAMALKMAGVAVKPGGIVPGVTPAPDGGVQRYSPELNSNLMEFSGNMKDLESQFKVIYTKRWDPDPVKNKEIQDKLRDAVLKRMTYHIGNVKDMGQNVRAAQQSVKSPKMK